VVRTRSSIRDERVGAAFLDGLRVRHLADDQHCNSRLWLAFGAIAGLGLENKYSIAVFAFGLLAGLLLSSQRKLLFTPWLFAGGGVALILFLPNLLWNIHHHWPFLELMHNIRVQEKTWRFHRSRFLNNRL